MSDINLATKSKIYIMPHCILEYSDNIIETDETLDVLSDLHDLLVETGHFQLEDIKSRTVCYEEFHIGDGNPENAFIHLHLSILSGRSLELRQQLSQQVLSFLEVQYSASLEQLNCSITVEISEIFSETYCKAVNSDLNSPETFTD